MKVIWVLVKNLARVEFHFLSLMSTLMSTMIYLHTFSCSCIYKYSCMEIKSTLKTRTALLNHYSHGKHTHHFYERVLPLKIFLGAFEVGLATMSKEDRCHVDEVYVFGFVPSYLLLKKHPVYLDPFMEPFINGKFYLRCESFRTL